MAKKKVKYAFGTPDRYNSILKKDDYTVYFVYDTVIDGNGKEVPGEYGTIYKGGTCIGSACAKNIVFDKDLTVTVLQGETDADSVFYTISAGTSLTDFVDGIIKQVAQWDEKLYSDFVGDGTPANPGIIYATIAQECEQSTAGNSVGIISETINTRIAEGLENNGVINSFLEENFVSKSNLGRIEELANILTPETTEILIQAAGDIADVLSAYYTKEESDIILKDIITCDSSTDFPETGDPNKLYVSSDDNYLYRWGEYEFEGELFNDYVLVSGGGSGSTNVEVKTNILIKNGAASVSIAKGSSYTVEYAFTSANSYKRYHPINGFEEVQEQIGAKGDVRYYLDGILIGSGECIAANYDTTNDNNNIYNSYTIPAGRFTGTRHTLKIECVDVEGHAAEPKTIEVNVINVSITSSYSANPAPLTSEIYVPVTVASTNSVDIFYKIDDDDEILATTVVSGFGTNNIPISNLDSAGNVRTHGIHHLEIWAKTVIAATEQEIITNHLTWEFIWFDPLNTTPVVSFICSDEQDIEGNYVTKQYEYSSFVYQAYPRCNIQLVTCKKADPSDPLSGDVTTVVKDLTNVSTAAHKWTYIFNEPGTYELYAIAINPLDQATITSDAFTITVNPSDYSMDPVDGAILYMNAQNHDNNGSHEWTSLIHKDKNNNNLPPINAILTNFGWNNTSGWYTEDATTSLRVGAGARCEIPFYPFEFNYKDSGMTIEIDFSTSNLSDSQTKVIECYSPTEKRGITITATGAYWETGDWSNTSAGDSRIYVPFKEGERVRLSFVMTPYAADDSGNNTNIVDIWNDSTKTYTQEDSVANGWWRFLKVYVNGICTSIDSYSNDGNITQSTALSSIKIGSDNATVDIYNIRVYPKVLYDKDIITNYIADTQDPDQKLELFLRNNILNDTGTAIDRIKLSTMLPCLYVTCESTSAASGFSNSDNILPINKKDKRGYTVIYNCDNLDDKYKEKFPWAKSFIAYNAQMCVQGTSSQYYPRKNYKLTFKPDKTAPIDGTGYLARTASSYKKPTLLYTDTTGIDYTPGSDMSNDDFVMSSILTEEMKSKYNSKYTLRQFDSDVAGSDLEHVNSIKATKYCLKADYMESSSVHNTGLAKYADYLLKSIGPEYLTPPQLSQYYASNRPETEKMNDVTIRTTVDGYPCAIFWRPTYQDEYTFLGKYNFNFDKGAEEVFGFIGIIEDLENPYTGHDFTQFDEDYYDAAEPNDRAEYIPPVECWEFTNNTTQLCKFKNVTETSFTDQTMNNSGEMVPDWIESFENRHPDNDTLVNDIEEGRWVPKNFADFCLWVSSTDTTGYFDPNTKELPIPTAWNGSLETLISGAEPSTDFVTINATLDELNAGVNTTFADCIVYDSISGSYKMGVLEPRWRVLVTVEDGNEVEERLTPEMEAAMTQEELESADIREIINTDYEYLGYSVNYNPELNAWELGDRFETETPEVDKAKTYYISATSDTNYNKVYSYKNNAWTEIATLNDYALTTPKTYKGIVYNYDTAEYRLAKFYNELKDHMNVKFTLAYYLISEFFCCVDQRAKNMMFATWGYEPDRLSDVKSASDFETVEAADLAGYKPVYTYSLEDFVISDEGDEPVETETRTVKTVQYYVPKSCNYKYYPIFYDNDTILGVDNTGYLSFEPNVESTDTIGSGYAYNGADSVLWLNIKYTFNKEIEEIYAEMRKNGLTYSKIMYYFTDTQSAAWSENVYNMDAKFKYVEPATIGYIDFSKNNNGVYGVNVHDAYYLFECQGSRATHRAWWINNRLNYMDSRYDTGEYHDSWALFRIYTNLAEGTYDHCVEPDPTFYITPYSDMYIRIKFGSRYGVVRARKNTTYMVNSGTNDKYNDTETMVYGAPYILSYGDLSAKYVKLCNIGPSSKITELIIGHTSPYYNNNLENLSLNTANTALKKIDVRNCPKLSTLAGLDMVPSVEEMLATNTSLTNLNFSESGSNIKRIAYPASISSVKLVNMPFISNNGSNLTFEGYSNITSVWVDNCPALNSWKLVSNIANASTRLSAVRLVDVDWTIETSSEFAMFAKLLTLKGLDEHGSTSYTAPYISGVVRLASTIVISDGYKEGVADYIRNSANGAVLTILGGNEQPISGISISGDTIGTGSYVITPGVEYTFTVHYNPDDYALNKGVNWTITDDRVIENVGKRTENSITLKFVGSTSGTDSFNLIATTTNTPIPYTSSIIVRPGATLSFININHNGQRVTNSIEIYEGDSINLDLTFTPENTTDTNVVITLSNEDNFVQLPGGNYFEYSSTTNTISLTANSVSQQRTSVLRVVSADVPSVYTTVTIIIKNIVSRIVNLRNATGGNIVPVEGYAYVQLEGSDTRYTVYSDSNGVITMPTNEFDLTATTPKFGYNQITVEPHALDENTKKFNRPEPIIFPAMASTVETDSIENVNFYEPNTYNISVYNGGALVNAEDVYLMITSLENENTGYNGISEAPYNKVYIEPGVNPVQMKLLANTTHHITIEQTSGKTTAKHPQPIYSTFNGVVKTGTTGENPNIRFDISKDYLSRVANYEDTELHMVVATGINNYKTVRLYIRLTGPVVIHWGDDTVDVIDTTTLLQPTNGETPIYVSYDLNREYILYHTYPDNDTEYELYVKGETYNGNSSNTENILWLHVIPSTATAMAPCIGTANNNSSFPTNAAWNANQGGLVGYLSAGAARLCVNSASSISGTAVPKFNFTDKTKSKLICVGNIYKNIGNEMTSAEGLFMNSTLEQIPNETMFRYNPNIKSFKQCFMNTNITTLPNNFFGYNTKAVNFEQTFKNCTNISNINTTANTLFINTENLVEVESVGEMFAGCTALTSEVPKFWERFFGDCFIDNAKIQGIDGTHIVRNSFANCVNVSNYSEIPTSWGGTALEYTASLSEIPLKYIELPNHSAGQQNSNPISGRFYNLDAAGVKFELDNVTLSNKDNYVFEFTIVGKRGTTQLTAYEHACFFGAAVVPNNKLSDLTYNDITNVIDLSWNGGPGTYNGPHTGHIKYRNGDASLIDIIKIDDGDGSEGFATYPVAYTTQEGTTPMKTQAPTGAVNTNMYWNPGDTIRLDFCHDTEGEVYSIKLDENGDPIQGTKLTGFVNYLRDENTPEIITNTPLRLFSSYYVKINAITQEDMTADGVEPYNKPFINEHTTYQFKSLQIYDKHSNLKHNIIPMFGSVNSKYCAYVKDTVTGQVYLPEGGSNNVLQYTRYYKK